MRTRIGWRHLAVFLALTACGLSTSETVSLSASHDRGRNGIGIDGAFTAPLGFEPNHGQADPSARFLARGRGFTLFLTSTEAIVSVRRDGNGRRARAGAMDRLDVTKDGLQSAQGDRPLILRMEPVGANPAARVTGESPLPGRVSYVGNSHPNAPLTSIPTYARVRYHGVYPGIDLVYYGNGQQLEYDFIVAPGAEPGRIRLAFTGADRLTLNATGELVLHTAAGELRQPQPLVYQEVDGVRREVAGSYLLSAADEVTFRVSAYDVSRPLVIDPVLAYSTYFGGSSDDMGWDVAVDSGGNVFISGARPSVRSPEAYDYDAFVAKFSPAGALLWITNVGDTCDDEGRGIALDRRGSVYVTGHLGYCYPFPELAGGAFVAKLSTIGALSYLFPFSDQWSGSDVGQAVAVDSAGQAYVTGLTSSGYFPTTAGAFQQQYSGGIADGFAVKVNAAGTALLYATYLGGTDHESPNDIAVDSAGQAYVTGSTYSTDFPTRSAFQPQHPAWGVTGFVTKLTADGSDLVYSTYLGGGTSDIAMGIAVDAFGHAFVTGVTESSEFPTTPGVVQSQPGDNRLCFYRLCTDAFVTKLSPSGTAIVYSTYLGGDMFDEGVGIAVDAAGNASVTGSTSSFTFPTVNAFQPQLAGQSDAFVAKLNASGSALVYSSYLGGSQTSEEYFDGYDSGIRIAVNAAGTSAYVVGQTYSSNFPVAAAHQPTAGGGQCGFLDYRCADAFVTKISAP